jgi:hypothetical protein
MSTEDTSLMIEAWETSGILTKGYVSAQIEEFKGLPKRAQKAAEPGYYTYDGDMYVVVKTRDGKRTYAKHLERDPHTGHWSWEYAPGSGRVLADFKPLTIEEAAAFGHLHGKCVVCLRQLTEPASVKAGIGPVCRKKVAR